MSFGSSPEVYEKVDPESGRGLVSLFASKHGDYRYVTRSRVTTDAFTSDNVAVERLPDGRARLIVAITRDGAGFALFG